MGVVDLGTLLLPRPRTMNKMKNFKRRFSLSVPRTETIEESLAEFTEQLTQLHNRRNEGEGPANTLSTALGIGAGVGVGRSPLESC